MKQQATERQQQEEYLQSTPEYQAILRMAAEIAVLNYNLKCVQESLLWLSRYQKTMNRTVRLLEKDRKFILKKMRLNSRRKNETSGN